MTTAKFAAQAGNYPSRLNKRESKVVEAAQRGLQTEAELLTALANAANNAVIKVSGTITLSDTLVISKPVTLKSDSGAVLTASSTFAKPLISIQLVAQSAAAKVKLEGLTISQADADYDCIDVGNTSVGQVLTVELRDCSVNLSAAASDAWALDVAHAAAGTAVLVNIHNSAHQTVGPINWTTKNAADRLTVIESVLSEAQKAACIVGSADNLASEIKLVRCEGTHEKVTSGGHASQTVRALTCYSNASGAFAPLDTADLIGSHSEDLA